MRLLNRKVDEIGREFIYLSPTARILFKDNDVYFVANTDKGLLEYKIDSTDNMSEDRLMDLYQGFNND